MDLLIIVICKLKSTSTWKLFFQFTLPATAGKYSGKFVVRMPKSLHQRLAIEAEQQGVSLNQLAVYKLAL